MNHNPHNFKPGDTVQLDGDLANTSQVIIFDMTPNKMLSTVYPAGVKEPKINDMWSTMTNRLSPISLMMELVNFDLSKEKQDEITAMFEKVMDKYRGLVNKSVVGSNEYRYFAGVSDGINNCIKMINGTEDDYLAKP